jgi:4-hydroxybenzoate polyprenyltransferase
LIRESVRLIRPGQWYKNLLVFAAAFFSMNLFNVSAMLISIYGFFALCLISSASYALNDVFDYKRDRKNPEKKNRPIAKGAISRTMGILISVFLYILGFYLAYAIGFQFFALAILLSVLTWSYNLYFKQIIFADVILISNNFVLRAIAGVILINVELSPWFFLSIFFFSFFLVFGKRHGDIVLMGKDAWKYKPVLKDYDLELLRSLMQVFVACLIILYGLYAFFANHIYLLFLYPFLIYILFRYYYLVRRGEASSRNPENIFFDLPILIASALFLIGVFIVIYLI